MTSQRQVVLASRPEGTAGVECFALREAPIPELAEGEVLTRNLFLSVDPYMRGRMGQAVGYAGAFELERPIPARVVAQVASSRAPGFAEGDFVWGFLAWEEATRVHASRLRKVDPALGPLSHAISVRGMPGLTAEVGLIEIGRPRPGDTVFVSAATGAVGQVVGQLARLAGCRVVGSAGSDAKVEHALGALGYHEAFNYRSEPATEALARCCPDGIDIVFDNVGGETLDAALGRLNTFARVPVCGQISQYSRAPGEAPYGLVNAGRLLATRSTMTGFVIYDHMHLFDDFVVRMARLLRDDRLTYFEDVTEGLESAPEAFVGMMAGDNLGKRLVRVAGPVS